MSFRMVEGAAKGMAGGIRWILSAGMGEGRISLVWKIALLGVYAGIAGCGSRMGSQPAPTGSSVPVIDMQPQSETTPLGDTATFTVKASADAMLTYQWMLNGSPINGAVMASYTTPAVTAADSGEKFSVTVSDGAGQTSSNPATLTVGPRSPMPGDMRFQEVDAPSEATQGTDGDIFSTSIPVGTLGVNKNAVGSPLQLGDVCVAGKVYDCIWGIWTATLPSDVSSLTFYDYGGAYSAFSADLQNGIAGEAGVAGNSNAVITSLDLQPASSAYAITWLQQSQGAGFDLRREVVAPNAVDSTVAADGRASRVVTAVSYDDDTGEVNLMSYGWQGDTQTQYDTSVLHVTASDVGSAATSLAQEGFIITAFGGNDGDGYLMVGTKVHGDSMPRPVMVISSASLVVSSNLAGYAPVAWATYQNSAGSEQGAIVYEK